MGDDRHQHGQDRIPNHREPESDRILLKKRNGNSADMSGTRSRRIHPDRYGIGRLGSHVLFRKREYDGNDRHIVILDRTLGGTSLCVMGSSRRQSEQEIRPYQERRLRDNQGRIRTQHTLQSRTRCRIPPDPDRYGMVDGTSGNCKDRPDRRWNTYNNTHPGSIGPDPGPGRIHLRGMDFQDKETK